MAAPIASVASQDPTQPAPTVAVQNGEIAPVAAPEATHQAEVAHGDAHGSGGLPQLEMQHWAGQTRDAAMANVSTIASDTARAMVERLTGKTATAAEADAAVKGAA